MSLAGISETAKYSGWAPRRAAAPAVNVIAPAVNAADHPAANATEPAVNAIAAPVKRGRGRPRKVLTDGNG